MQLFDHNQKAYDNAVRMFDQENRLCIIQPTGTGKSLIIAEFVNQNPTKRHLLLAPGSHIFNEIKKHLEKPDILFSTYLGLAVTEDLFIEDSFDYIYLDEFHRLGADVWGGAVNRLLGLNPEAKVLGTSATHIRYLDDNRNMATEIFNDRIATHMSLNAAIANNILPAPTYVSALYSVRDELRKMKKKILSSNVENKDTLIRDLDSKVIDWENSSGLDTIIRKYLTSDRNRVVIFCKDWEHLKYAIKVLDPIFQKIYPCVKSLSVYAGLKDSENENNLSMFQSEDEGVLVLYTIDKLNEGLHAKKCSTVILLRDTISPIVFYQQIGRAFSVKPVNRPLIIDLVNNFRSMQLAAFKNDFEHELRVSDPAKYRQTSPNEEKKATIDFIDETQDIRSIFSVFDDNIDNWKIFYRQAKSYFEQYGHPYAPPSRLELMMWIRRQRKAYYSGRMGKKRIALLQAIGMNFDREIPLRWITVVNEIKEWVREHGALPTEENPRLYSWMTRQRQAIRGSQLSDAQISILRNLIPFEDRTIEERIEKLVKYFKDGNRSPYDPFVRHDLHLTKLLVQKKRLPDTTIVALRNANVPIDESLQDFVWLEKAKKMLAFYEKNGRPPKNYYSKFESPEEKEESSLYAWCIRERRYLNRKHPCAKFIGSSKEAGILYDRLKAIITTMERRDWDALYAELTRIVETHGKISNSHCDKNLAMWVYKQRRQIREGNLEPEKLKKLLAIKEVNWHIPKRQLKKTAN